VGKVRTPRGKEGANRDHHTPKLWGWGGKKILELKCSFRHFLAKSQTRGEKAWDAVV